MNTPRVPPVTDPSREFDEPYDKAGLRAPDGSPLNIFSTLAHHPPLLRRWLVFATHVLAENWLAPRDRELLIPANRMALQIAVRDHNASFALNSCGVQLDDGVEPAM